MHSHKSLRISIEVTTATRSMKFGPVIIRDFTETFLDNRSWGCVMSDLSYWPFPSRKGERISAVRLIFKNRHGKIAHNHLQDIDCKFWAAHFQHWKCSSNCIFFAQGGIVSDQHADLLYHSCCNRLSTRTLRMPQNIPEPWKTNKNLLP